MTRRFLTNREKHAIVEEAYSSPNNIRETARKHGVGPSQIRRWKVLLQDIMADEEDGNARRIAKVMKNKTTHRGRESKSAVHFNALRERYDTLRSMDRAVNTRLLSVDLKWMAGNDDEDHNNQTLAALSKRISRWLRNEDIVIHRVTRVAQNTRLDEAISLDFVEFINSQIEYGKFGDDFIVNMDETNIKFDMVGTTTLASRGSRTIAIKTTGSPNRCTVLLAVTMSGQKLPPFVIFKGKHNGRIMRSFANNNNPNFPISQRYTCQENAWMDRTVFLHWVEQVWKPFVEGRDDEKTYLLMDDFSVHKMGECVNAVKMCGSDVDHITPGYTSGLQVLDVGINKPFKGYVRDKWEEFMVNNVENRKAQREDVAKWIEAAWEKVTVETIRNTWRSVGFKSYEPNHI
jgi:transposase-like protein